MWITLDVERLLYVDDGVDIILCDRWVPASGKIVVRLSSDAVAALKRDLGTD